MILLTRIIPEFKPWRNKSKTGSYLLAYGGGVGKLASSLGLSKSEAQVAYDNYWIANYGLGQFGEGRTILLICW